MKKQPLNGRKPFFAQFLENQDRLNAPKQEEVQGGIDAVTLKYPSDGEDNPITLPAADVYQTQKYPSDSEDNPGTKPAADHYETQKYPSDGDDDIVAI